MENPPVQFLLDFPQFQGNLAFLVPEKLNALFCPF